MNMNGINQPAQYMAQNPYTPMTRSNGIQWVQGVEGAKAFQLMPNSNTILMDSENDVFYIKTCDNIGMCNLRAFKYEEVTNTPNNNAQIDLSNYVTRDEVEEMLKSIKGGLGNGKHNIQSTKSATTESK